MQPEQSISDHKKSASAAKDDLRLMILQSRVELRLASDAPLIQRANHALDLLSPAEARWLNKKDWNTIEKTYILYHVDHERSKKKASNFLPLSKVAIVAGMASVALAAQYKDHHSLAALLALVTATTALSTIVDYAKNQIVDNIFEKRILNCLSHENDNIKTGMHCLTRRSANSY